MNNQNEDIIDNLDEREDSLNYIDHEDIEKT